MTDWKVVDLKERRIPGNARKWAVLRMLADHPLLTTREMAALFGWEGPPPPDGQRDGYWRSCLAHAGNELRYMEKRGWVRRAGTLTEGWGKGNPGLWEITPAGLTQLDVIAGQRETHDRIGNRSAQKARAAGEREAETARRARMADAMRDLYPDRTRPAERRQAVLVLRDAGLRLQEIGDVFGITREMVRQDLIRAEMGDEAYLASKRRAS
jgi:DNA-directed RNA polymerase specialized sigma24 family protein